MHTVYRVVSGSCLVGNVVEKDGGFVFVPKLPHRRVSRVVRSTPDAAIPPWAKRLATEVVRVNAAYPPSSHGKENCDG